MDASVPLSPDEEHELALLETFLRVRSLTGLDGDEAMDEARTILGMLESFRRHVDIGWKVTVSDRRPVLRWKNGLPG